MKKIIKGEDIPNLKVGMSLDLYQGVEEKIDSVVLLETNQRLNTIKLKSSSNTITSTFVFITEAEAWFLCFEGLTEHIAYSPSGPLYNLRRA